MEIPLRLNLVDWILGMIERKFMDNILKFSLCGHFVDDILIFCGEEHLILLSILRILPVQTIMFHARGKSQLLIFFDILLTGPPDGTLQRNNHRKAI